VKLLVDTCVWSLALRRRSADRLSVDERELIAELGDAIQDRRAAIVGPVRQEILSGIRDRAQFLKTRELLDPFPDEKIVDHDYIEAARLFSLCQDRGFQCGPVDILLCAVAGRSRCQILTNDSGLQRCIGVLRAEGIMP
jgi:predicted nucleic acid-binding protein